MDELYDLAADPFEIKNIIGEKRSAALVHQLDAERANLLNRN
jgi:hypothetical protein